MFAYRGIGFCVVSVSQLLSCTKVSKSKDGNKGMWLRCRTGTKGSYKVNQWLQGKDCIGDLIEERFQKSGEARRETAHGFSSSYGYGFRGVSESI